jgi:NAD(P)-dependent dehydrogenase (short-subunit alcohol dehydrogenase family)
MSAFRGQTAVVTGASSGIGRAIALELLAGEASVYLVGRSRERLGEVADEAGEASGRARCVETDLAVDGQVLALAGGLRREAGRVDILVHSAGIITLGTVESCPVEELDRQYRVNLRGPYLLTQALVPLLRESRGQIVFINSSVGLASPGARVGQYAATKHGLRALAESLRAELNPDGVRVLSVFPGRTATPMQESVFREEGRAYTAGRLLQPRDIAASVVAALGLPRTAEVTDINLRPLSNVTGGASGKTD